MATTKSKRVVRAFQATACLALCMSVLIAGVASAAITVDFNDGTTGVLNNEVNVSSRQLSIAVGNDVHAPPVSGQAVYISNAYGSPGQDKAAIDTYQNFDDVVVSGVVSLYGTGYNAAGGGVVAGMPAAGGSGYLLYLTQTWEGGDAAWWDSSVGGLWQLVLVKMQLGSAYPLSSGNAYQAVAVPLVQDASNFVQLSVNGNTITGQVWLGQTSPTGSPTATVSLTDGTPLSGYAGVYLAARNARILNYGRGSVDNVTMYREGPPNGVTNLAVTGLDWYKADLQWSAPSEDLTAPMSAYDLRYSTLPIVTDDDFAAATQVTGLPTPDCRRYGANMHGYGSGSRDRVLFRHQSHRRKRPGQSAVQCCQHQHPADRWGRPRTDRHARGCQRQTELRRLHMDCRRR